ncbi:MAG TPA: hypothetical protein VMS56_12245 [Thermoanaerobaculia bacterium]|nr:hypothetical protein [Thermoanaerobaculia bacterium]
MNEARRNRPAAIGGLILALAALVALPLISLFHVHPAASGPQLSAGSSGPGGSGLCWLCRASHPETAEPEIGSDSVSLRLAGPAASPEPLDPSTRRSADLPARSPPTA